MKHVITLGRLLFALIFISSSFGHFNEHTIAFAASKGLPLASLLVPLSGIIELAGGLSILFGFRPKIGAWLLVLFLVPVTLTFHQFWTVADPMARQMEFAAFLKNISMLGGALVITQFGAGEFSLDNLLKRKSFTTSKTVAG
jgi:putative oxidoreductase